MLIYHRLELNGIFTSFLYNTGCWKTLIQITSLLTFVYSYGCALVDVFKVDPFLVFFHSANVWLDICKQIQSSLSIFSSLNFKASIWVYLTSVGCVLGGNSRIFFREGLLVGKLSPLFSKNVLNSPSFLK